MRTERASHPTDVLSWDRNSETLPWSLPSALSWLLATPDPSPTSCLLCSTATQVSEQGLLHAANPEGLEICLFFHQSYLTPGIGSSSLQEMMQYFHVTCTQPSGHCKPPLADSNTWCCISTAYKSYDTILLRNNNMECFCTSFALL